MNVRRFPLKLAYILFLVLMALVLVSPTQADAGRVKRGVVGQQRVTPHNFSSPPTPVIVVQGVGPAQPIPPLTPAEEAALRALVVQAVEPAQPVPVPTPTEEAALRALVVQAVEPKQPIPQPPVPEPPLPEAPTPLEPEAPTPLEPESPPVETPQAALLLERGAILLPRGTLQVEPSLEYSRLSTNRVAISGFTIFEAIVVGTIRVDKLDRDIITGALTARYGLLDRLQLETRIPFLYRRDSEVLGVGTADARDRTISAFGLGDIEASVSWQALIGRQWLPDVILRLRSKFPTGKDAFEVGTERVEVQAGIFEERIKEPPTGSGFYSVSPTSTLVWRSDPAVFFIGGGYYFNLERDVGGNFGTIDPGNTVEFFAGLNIALSERLAISMSFTDQITGSTKQNGNTAPGTSFNDARLTLGTSIALYPNVSLLVGVSAGLTAESPDFQVAASLPVAFKLFR